MTDKNKFHGDAGRFLSGSDALARTARYRRYKQGQGHKPDSFTRGEFFGINRINKLLGRKDCVGIRVYYGKTFEDADGNIIADERGELTSRLVIVGVREDGTDIFDDPTGKKDAGDGDALGDGLSCPRQCGNPPSTL